MTNVPNVTNVSNVPNVSSISKILFGVPQSRYAGIAFMISCILFIAAIILIRNKLQLYDRFLIIFTVLLISIPGVALAFFKLTCIVTGTGPNNKYWWCSLYAWIYSAIIIFYSICLIIYALIPLTNNKDTIVDTFADIDTVNNLIRASSSNINNISSSNINTTTGSNIDPNFLPFEYSDQLTLADILNNSR